jgi:ABC-type nitrate/sulfonate/bicarbonate transport system permease component
MGLGTVINDAAVAPSWIRSGARRLLDSFITVLPIFVLLVVWEILARLGVLDSRLLPPPSRIISAGIALLGLGTGQLGDVLLPFLLVSIRRVAIGFALGGLAGMTVGMLIGTVKVLQWFSRPLLSVIMPVPMLAWTPVFLLALGRGDRTVIAVIMADTLLPVLYHTVAGIRGISRLHVWAVKSMGGSTWDVIRLAWFPGMLPQVMTGFRLAVGLAWRALVVAEMLGADSGVGFMIFAARQYMATAQMFLGIAIIGMGGFLSERVLLGALEGRTVKRWGLVRRA